MRVLVMNECLVGGKQAFGLVCLLVMTEYFFVGKTKEVHVLVCMLVMDACLLGGKDTSALVCWVGKEACGLAWLLTMNESLLWRHRSKWFGMVGGQRSICSGMFVGYE